MLGMNELLLRLKFCTVVGVKGTEFTDGSAFSTIFGASSFLSGFGAISIMKL